MYGYYLINQSSSIKAGLTALFFYVNSQALSGYQSITTHIHVMKTRDAPGRLNKKYILCDIKLAMYRDWTGHCTHEIEYVLLKPKRRQMHPKNFFLWDRL